MMKALAAAAFVAMTGCLTHMNPDRDPVHLRIDWREDYEMARSDAREIGRPVLAVLIAGDILDNC